MEKYNHRICFLFLLFSIAGCADFEPAARKNNAILDGPIEGLSSADNIRHRRGDIAFNDVVFTSENGLGPIFVANSCASCHPGDGKGHPSTTLTRFGQIDESGNHFLNNGGPQLQPRAIPGFSPELIPAGATFAKFTPPANTGLGFIDAVSDGDILAWADPNDVDNDGISGIPNWVNLKNYITMRPGSVAQDGKYMGRFGKKGATYNLLQQTVTAYNQDIGITSIYEPYDTYSRLEIDPEVSDQTINDVVFYLRTLKAPIPRALQNEIIPGKKVFMTIGCEKCHRSEMKTITVDDIPALSEKTFYPYTDLLLHDMGPGLDDGYTEGAAKTHEWRTAPLWGLGLSKKSQGGEYFLLHDGRARSIESAILLHGGEATQIIDNYQSLSEEEKRSVILFLESL